MITPLFASLALAGALTPVTLSIEPDARVHDVSPNLYGAFFEDYAYGADGGLYPELVANRGFDLPSDHLKWWTNDFRGEGNGRLGVQFGAPLHPNTAAHLRIESFGGGDVGIRNAGYFGIAVRKGETYRLALCARGLDGYAGDVRVALEDGPHTLASVTVPNRELPVAPARPGLDSDLPAWRRFTFDLVPDATTTNATLSVLATARGTIEIDQVSLFPKDTFRGRANGLRKDMAERIAALHPAFLRFPGGCVLEGVDFRRWCDWKRTVGPLERRTTVEGLWSPIATHGLGYFEYFQLCEDLGCEPLPILSAGLACQFRSQDRCPLSAIDHFTQSALDLIEFANGPTGTTWGAVRAAMGHPAPFHLKFLGVGNENWGEEFFVRYDAIAPVLAQRHPEIHLVASAGPSVDDDRWRQALAHFKETKAEIVDEHFYRSPEWFFANAGRYDAYDRTGPKIYIGEYAGYIGRGTSGQLEDPANLSCLYTAIGEAAFLTGVERNADLVRMTSFAPLMTHEGYAGGWQASLIHFDGLNTFVRSSWHVQRLFGANRPDWTVRSQCAAAGSGETPLAGRVVLTAWRRPVEFRDIAVRSADGRTLFAGLPKLTPELAKTWSVDGDVLRRKFDAASVGELAIGEADWHDYTLTLKTRACGDGGGILVRAAAQDIHGIQANLSGWGDTKHALEADGYRAADVPAAALTDGSFADGKWHDVELTVAGRRATLRIDGRPAGELVLPAAARTTDFFETCGRSANGDLIVKLVNRLPRPRPVKLDFARELKSGTLVVTTLGGDDPLAENTMARPDACRPETRELPFAGGRTYATELGPTSLTILRFKSADAK